ncbi:DUF2254 domain-containing protein [Lichenihabitans sp. Uapishka_5]|uniref:DUF2254 domain-containing protein n=1 Tax=Lichenihabitans sp. Uapishka_5 TaxID=3037302 RepID=UPI0029E7E761|nr:DUF2254 domain-containing protein [Lichenihabitans sp. Uapishka_5]MDX7952646.1 DUF2254 domain-containing protein [Lichenihabitans sp. Uapishka_5]
MARTRPLSRLHMTVARLLRQAWVKAAFYCLGGIAVALLAWRFQFLVPEDFALSVGADAVGNILTVLASSMLTVTTFSLTVLVSALGSASSGVTPRATTLWSEDRRAHNALATFIGAFMFSVVGIIALSTHLYGSGGRLLLLGATVVLIGMIVVTLLRWMQQLTRFGRVGESIRLVEEAAALAMRGRRDRPHLGGIPPDPRHRQPVPVFPERIGYVQYVDMAALSRALGGSDAMLDVAALPGTFVHPACPLAFVDDAMGPDAIETVRKAFLVDDDRSWEQDPRFGLSVLAEIGSKSLPPTAADYGTAIAVIGAALRVLAHWMPDRDDPAPDPEHPRIRVPALSTDDMLDDVFHPLAREGAGLLQVPMRLQEALAALAAMAPDQFAVPARRLSRLVTDHADAALILPGEKAAVQRLTLR